MNLSSPKFKLRNLQYTLLLLILEESVKLLKETEIFTIHFATINTIQI